MYRYLSSDEVVMINRRLINDFGGMHAVRNKGLIESAVYSPHATFEGKNLYQTMYEIAAAYAYHIIKDHPFVDGNKRTGIMSALLFLECNEQFVSFEPGQLYELGVKIATSKIMVDEIAWVLKSAAR